HAGLAAAVGALERVVEAGTDPAANQHRAWSELREIISERAKTVSVEARRLADLRDNVTIEQLLCFWTALIMAAKETITDQGMHSAFTPKALALMPPAAPR